MPLKYLWLGGSELTALTLTAKNTENDKKIVNSRLSFLGFY